MKITVGGKGVQSRSTVIRVGKHRQLTMNQVAKRHPADPFPPIEEFKSQSVEHRLSVGAELKMWVEQILDELSALADQEDWLRVQLREPEFMNHPDRPAAKREHADMVTQVEELASDIGYLEAHADRIWQSLATSDRDDMALRWVADVNDERLILTSWKHIAPVGFKWPDYYQAQYSWFECLADPLKADIKAEWPQDGLMLGKRHELDSDPESVDYMPEHKATFS